MIDEIDELEAEIQKYDSMFGMKSRAFPPDLILVSMPLDSWQIRITNKKYKKYCLLHSNRFGRINKYHIQAWKGSLFACFDSIYNHKKYLHITKGCQKEGLILNAKNK